VISTPDTLPKRAKPGSSRRFGFGFRLNAALPIRWIIRLQLLAGGIAALGLVFLAAAGSLHWTIAGLAFTTIAAAGGAVLVADLGRPFTAGEGADGFARRLLRDLWESDIDGLLVSDSAGVAVYANPAYRDLSDDGRAQMLSRLIDESDDETVRRLYRLDRAAAAGEEADEDLVLIGASTGRAVVTVGVRPIGSGRSLWRVALSALRRPQEPVAPAQGGDMLDRLPVGFLTADADGLLGLINETLAGWLGADRPSFGALSAAPNRVAHGTGLADLFGPGGADLLLGGPAGRGLVRTMRARLGPSDGHTPSVPVRVVAGTLKRSGSSPARLFAFLIDERMAGEAVSDADTGPLGFGAGRFFEAAPVGIALAAPDGQLLDANGAFRLLAGIGPGELPKLQDLAVQDERAELADRIAIWAAGEGTGDAPLDIRLAGPIERGLQLHAGSVEGAESRAALVIAVDTFRQRSVDLEAAQAQKAQAQKMQAVGQLAGGIAHDFNNLLTAIIGFSDLLLGRHQPGDPSFADIMQVKQNANRAASLVRQLLAFSRQQKLKPKVLDLTDVISDLSNLLTRLLGTNVMLNVVHGRNLGPIKGDPGQLEQVIINLAVNARDAMPEGGTLTIRTANATAADAGPEAAAMLAPGDYVMMEVTDTGTGIAPEHLAKIFDPFFTTKEVGQGTGLGLATVYGIVRQSGGAVVPTSVVGVGTTFRIYLPRHEMAEGEIDALPNAPDRSEGAGRDLSGKGTILLVEDEDAVRTFASRALTNRGYSMLEAANGEAAFDILRAQPGKIDLVISDVMMPNMDGPTLAREIRKLRPGLKMLFISGYAEEAFKKSLESMDSFVFLPKPFTLKQLAAKVKEVMSGEDGAVT
jgi:two-component system cell cycle sensor histidine kinase/response regulator CckA